MLSVGIIMEEVTVRSFVKGCWPLPSPAVVWLLFMWTRPGPGYRQDRPVDHANQCVAEVQSDSPVGHSWGQPGGLALSRLVFYFSMAMKRHEKGGRARKRMPQPGRLPFPLPSRVPEFQRAAYP